jgi:hypothetical protein
LIDRLKEKDRHADLASAAKVYQEKMRQHQEEKQAGQRAS